MAEKVILNVHHFEGIQEFYVSISLSLKINYVKVGKLLQPMEQNWYNFHRQGLRTPREEIAFTARPNIHSHSQIFRYDRIIFCLLHWPIFSDIFDLCLHWVSVVRGQGNYSQETCKQHTSHQN